MMLCLSRFPTDQVPGSDLIVWRASYSGVYCGILQRRLSGGGAGGATDRFVRFVLTSMWLVHRERNGEAAEERLDVARDCSPLCSWAVGLHRHPFGFQRSHIRATHARRPEPDNIARCEPCVVEQRPRAVR
jgi:hypothetical protein